MEKTEKEILEELGKKLKMARKAIKLSQSGLASKT
jgi:transcriptional regulator with XRE-family HTH domain